MNAFERKMVKDALGIAREIHKGQTRWNGDDYFIHHVEEVYKAVLDEEYTVQVAAALHDTVEDHPDKIHIEDLQKEFPQIIVDAVRALTKDKVSTYADYIIDWILPNPIAKKVKLADLNHNLSTLFTQKDISKERMKRLKVQRDKYQLARYIIKTHKEA